MHHWRIYERSVTKTHIYKTEEEKFPFKLKCNTFPPVPRLSKFYFPTQSIILQWHKSVSTVEWYTIA